MGVHLDGMRCPLSKRTIQCVVWVYTSTQRIVLLSKRTGQRRWFLVAASSGEDSVDADGAGEQRRVRDGDADVKPNLTGVTFSCCWLSHSSH